MFKKKRTLLFTLVLLLSLGILVGCSSEGNKNNKDDIKDITKEETVEGNEDVEKENSPEKYKEDEKGNIVIDTGKDFSPLNDEESAALTAKKLEEIVNEVVDDAVIVDVRPIFIEDGYYPHVSVTNPDPQTNEEIKEYFLDIIDVVKDNREEYPSKIFSLMWVTNDSHNEVYRQDFRVN